MFLRNCWYVAALDSELIDGKLLGRTILGDRVLIYRGDSGKIVALDNRCPHRGALLSDGRIEGDSVRCMYHGLRFNENGKCTQIPAQDMIPPKMKVRHYPTHQINHFIFIWMGDPALADPAKIPEVPALRDPNWKGIPAYLHYDANYILIVDNLSDLAHLAWVHKDTLGGSEEYAFVSKPINIEKNERGYRLARWHMNTDPPPFHKRVIPEKTAKLDRRNTVNMYVPGVFYMETLFAPAGQGAEKGVEVPGTREYRNVQFMTPETEKTTHFFWTYLNNYEGEDSTISQSLLLSLIEGFMEDKAIIEQQQKTLEETPDLPMLAILADAPLVHFRRTLEKMIAAEQAPAQAAPATAATGTHA